jgi:hypothetical protein
MISPRRICVSEQIEFVIGEPFTFYRRIQRLYLARGINVFVDYRLYVDWAFSPVAHLLKGPRGPWLLRNIPLSNGELWVALTALAAALYALAAWLLCCRRPSNTRPKSRKPPAVPIDAPRIPNQPVGQSVPGCNP